MPKRKIAFTPETASKRVKAALDTLPDEVLVDIFSYLPQSDVLSLLYSSKRFERSCKIRLYRHIVICEKLNDQYFLQLTRLQGKTLLSSWPNINKFFGMIYKMVKSSKNRPAFLSYVESIQSYNYLDSGKVDSYKSLTSEDLQNILKLRQMFDTVIDSFPNLKSLNTPLIPLEKLQYISPHFLSALRDVSITLDKTSTPESVPSFTNAQRLTINVCSRTGASEATLESLLSKNHHRVKHLELNGNFGRQDRRMEHTLRHASLHTGISPRAFYVKGFMDGMEEQEDMRGISEIEAEAYFNDGKSGWYNHDNGSSLAPLLDFHVIRPVEKLTLETFTLINWMIPDTEETEQGEWPLSLLKRSIKHKTLKEVRLVNCFRPGVSEAQSCFDALLRGPVFQNYDSLERITIGEINHVMEGGWNAEEHGYPDDLIESFRDYSMATPSRIAELKIYGNAMYSPIERGIVYMVGNLSHSLKKLTFIRFDIIEETCHRVMLCHAMRTSYKIGGYTDLDDELFGLSKDLIEFMNLSCRIDNYEQDEGFRTANVWVERFREDFIFLFRSEVKEVFDALPLLETFVLYGFPFKRGDV